MQLVTALGSLTAFDLDGNLVALSMQEAEVACICTSSCMFCSKSQSLSRMCGLSFDCAGATDHHFLVVEMSKGEVTSANNIWVQVAHAPEVSTSTSPSTCSKVSQHSMPAVDPSLLNNQQASSAAAAAGPGSSNSASHSGPAHTAASNGKDNVEMSPPCLQGHGKYRANVIRSHPLLRTVLDEGGRVKYAYTWDAHHLQEVFHDLSRPGTNTVSAADGGGVASSPIIAHNAAGSRGQEMAANLPA